MASSGHHIYTCMSGQAYNSSRLKQKSNNMEKYAHFLAILVTIQRYCGDGAKARVEWKCESWLWVTQHARFLTFRTLGTPMKAKTRTALRNVSMIASKAGLIQSMAGIHWWWPTSSRCVDMSLCLSTTPWNEVNLHVFVNFSTWR
jgi:hypothetical protein